MMTSSSSDPPFYPRKHPRSWFVARQICDPTDAWVRPEFFFDRPIDRPVGLINGGFDLLTAAHARLIAEARARSGTLICALDSDAKIRARKGTLRPVKSWPERAATLSYMGVDWLVEIDSDDDFVELVRAAVPEFRVLGSEYIDHKSRVPWIRNIYVRDTGAHSSDLVERILKGIK